MDEEAILAGIRERVHADKPLDELMGLPGSRVPTPATPDQVRSAEDLIRAPLPRLLARILVDIGNGGMGPGYGLLGIGKRGHKTDLGQDGLEIVHQVIEGRLGQAPGHSFPLCQWGCAIMSFVTPDGQVWGWDPNPIEPDQAVPFLVEDYHLAGWLQAWLEGTLLQPCAIEDGGSWRAATPVEKREAMRADRS
jgi:hypothetical protein